MQPGAKEERMSTLRKRFASAKLFRRTSLVAHVLSPAEVEAEHTQVARECTASTSSTHSASTPLTHIAPPPVHPHHHFTPCRPTAQLAHDGLEADVVLVLSNSAVAAATDPPTAHPSEPPRRKKESLAAVRLQDERMSLIAVLRKVGLLVVGAQTADKRKAPAGSFFLPLTRSSRVSSHRSRLLSLLPSHPNPSPRLTPRLPPRLTPRIAPAGRRRCS